MEENTRKNLPFILEVLIVAVIVFGLKLLVNWFLSPFHLQIIQNAAWMYMVISFVTHAGALFFGGCLCFKILEKRKLSVSVFLLVSILLPLLCWAPNTLLSNYIARFGVESLTLYSQINAYVSPLFDAVVMAVIVRALCAPKASVSANDPSARIGLVVHVLLLLFTGSVWHLIWIYRTTCYLNCVPGEEYRNPATKLLLCMLVPFYSIYWVYKSAQRIDKLAKTVDVTSDLAVVCVILEMFIPLIPPILMQDKINKIQNAGKNHIEF